ncbi:MAG: SurA N-terminal domain-containing protein, partial [Alphaproteobacteria bacterium]|nr:SurA N-terminal domain-containing protein [Alphaproteobacteria bacterium]
MLEYLRNASNKLAAKILMGILIFSFVGWGVASWIFGESRIDDSVLRAGSAPLKIQTFENEKSRMLGQMSKEEQKRVYTDRGARADFLGQILSKLTSQIMLQQRAYDLGMTVSPAHVARLVRSEPAFQTDGKFDIGRFNATLYYAQITEDQLTDSIRSQALREMILAGVGTPITAPKFMAGAMYQSRHAMRDIEYATVKFSDFKAPGNPTDDQLRETYAKNPKAIPEFRTISYVLVPAKMDTPDSFEAGYKTAQKLEDALIGGESMQSAAAKFGAKFVSLPPLAKPADLSAGAPAARSPSGEGWLAKADSVMNASMLADAFAMDQGIESPIVETRTGFVIFRVDGVAPQHNAPFDSVKKDLAGKWQQDEQRKQAYEKANELLIKLNATGGLPPEAAQQRRVGRAVGAPLEVLNAAFANAVDTKTIVPASDAFYVLNIKRAGAPAYAEAPAGKPAAIEKEANTMLNRAISDDYMAFLTRKYPVK